MALLQLKKRRLYEEEDENELQSVPKKVCHRHEPNPVLQTEKMQSVLRGLLHVGNCNGCANKLCISTSAFVKKVELHLKTQPVGHNRSQCAACKLWTVIVQEHAEQCNQNQCNVPLCDSYRVPQRDEPPI
ncbi:hypothetical protein THRCLA_21813 [Thraustotheca clavata]|uniref:Uncharacterized protein n=1 Tax=Thraustotheca clavata TaxID=74557 RepID=A0A1V9ZNK6_9STRA|nr:hypothetical protein THRCLA_21813 [Thraustotheca clavata]